jgi:hypothetical protein
VRGENIDVDRQCRKGGEGSPPGGTGADPDKGDVAAGRDKLRCPLCAWVPRKSDRWFCTCGCAWNTFDTGGRCPECSYQWTETQCFACEEFSPHRAWYAGERGQA